MRVLIDALSVNNQSGRHVLMGHLSQLAAWTAGEHEYLVVHHARNRDMVRDLPDVEWLEAPPRTVHWLPRRIWEVRQLPSLVREVGCDFLFSPAGLSIPGLPVPQAIFCQNPWCLVDGLRRSPRERVKALLQRRAYRRTVYEADLLIFNSRYMRSAYEKNADRSAEACMIVYQAIDADTRAAAESRTGNRDPYQIVSASAMASHKGAETLVRALNLVRSRHHIPARLVLVGSWPDQNYQRAIRRLIRDTAMEDAVTITGHVSRDALHQSYAGSRLFSLMSHCESFGIPAVEAQTFGTPVVSSRCCAIPEVCGEGGLYAAPGDVEATAACFVRLLSDDGEWEARSRAALRNASRFTWEECSQPLLGMFDFMKENVRSTIRGSRQSVA